MLWVKALLTWILFIPIAMANGLARDMLYKKYVGDLPAHQISTIIAVFLFIFLSFLLLRSDIAKASFMQVFLIGILFVLFTISFEFGVGHYFFHTSWNRLFADYNIVAGRIWIWFLVTEFFTPMLLKLFGQE